MGKEKEALLEVLSKDARIKPGMTANVEIEVDQREDAITVPVEAIVHRMRKDLPTEIVRAFDKLQDGLDVSERVRQGQYIKVLYIMEDDAASVRLANCGIADTRRVEISEGLSIDDVVVVGPYRSLDQLTSGKKIALAEDDKKDSEDPKDETESGDEEVAQEDKTEKGSKADDDRTKLATNDAP